MSALLHDLLLRLDQWHATLQQLGWVGVLGYAIGLVVLQMAFVPLAVFGVAAGAIFGFWKGVMYGALTCGLMLVLITISGGSWRVNSLGVFLILFVSGCAGANIPVSKSPSREEPSSVKE